METSEHESERDRSLEDQGLPTSTVDDDHPGRSFQGDEPEAGSDGNLGTKSDDLDADDADAAREADEAERAEHRGHESIMDDDPTYDDDPTARDAPPADVEQPIPNPDSPLGRELR